VSREGSGRESASRVPWKGEGGVVSAAVVHVEWTEEELLGIEYGGLGRVISTGR